MKLWCGVECHGVILNVLWYGYIRLCVAFRAVCSFCNYVVFSRVMSVQYCLYVSRISVHSVQCQSIASAQFYSVQCKQCSESVQFLKHSVYRVVCSIHSQWCSVLATEFMVCLLLFSVGGVQSSIRLSVGLRV